MDLSPPAVTKFYVPKRYIVTLLCFFGLFNAYSMRVNVSVAIVAMVNHTEHKVENITFATECPAVMRTEKTEEEPLKGERYNWDSATQGLILSAFFYGNLITMIPGGYLAEKIGATRLFGACIISTALLTLLTPIVVKWGVVPFLVLRFLVGIGGGPIFPSVIAIISNWSPKMERSRITSIVFTGVSIGNVFSFTISGLLCGTDALGGWPSVFYFFGALGCLWFIAWVTLVYETPNIHPTISKEELTKFADMSCTTKKNGKVPWKSIATSIPFWAAVFTNIGHMFGFTIMITEIPTYLNSVLHFNIKSSGILSALPSIADAIGGWIAPFIADKLRSSEKIGITPIRKIFNSIAGFGPSVCLLIVAYSGCRSTLIVSLLTFGLFQNGFKYSGFIASIVDMSPDFAGVLFGIGNGISTIAAIIAPTMTGIIISTGGTIANWSKVFSITAGIYFFTTAIFAIFGSSDLQPWGVSESDGTKEEKSSKT